MRATSRKVRGVASFYAQVEADGRPVWMCSHSHPSRRKANACARSHLKHMPRSGPAALRLLRRSWTPGEVQVPTDPQDGRPVLSRSYVESFLQCVQYRDDHSPDAAFGTVVHDAVYTYWQLCVAERAESMLAEVDRLVREAFFRPGAAVDPNRYEEARELVQGFVESRTLELHRLLIVERAPAIEFTLRADNGWCWLTGRADRIDRADGEDPDDPPRVIRLRDYKSGWAPSGGKALDGAPSTGSSRLIPHDFQRRFYAWLAFHDPRLSRDLEAVETEIDWMRYRGEPEVITYWRDDLEAWGRDMLWGLAQQWARRTAPPTGCAACTYCADRITCAGATTEARAIPTDDEAARGVAQEWIRSQARTKGLRDALAGYMQERDPMVVGGLEVGFLRPRQASWKPIRDKTIEIVKHLDLAGLNGQAATYPAGVAADKIPEVLRAPMVEAGLARWEVGPPAFKARKAGEEGS